MKKRWPYAALVLLFILMHDLWFWDDPQLVLGMPVGLTYHVGFCLLASAVLYALVRVAWPFSEESEEERS